MMCHLEVEPKSSCEADAGADSPGGDIHGIMGLSGTLTGTLTVSLPDGLARRAVSALLGFPMPEAINHDIRDGVGELTNMIAGKAKSLLVRTPFHFSVSVPSVVTGSDLQFSHPYGAARTRLFFRCGDEEFSLVLVVNPSAKPC